MKRKRFTEEQIVAILQEAAATPGAGRATARRHGITETTLYRWRAKYGAMQTSDVRRLRQLKDENARLKKLVAGLSRDVAMLKGEDPTERRGGAKLVTTDQRRSAVTYLRATYPVSARRACRLTRLVRSRWQHRSTRPSDVPLAEALRAKAEARPRWGYRRLAVLLRRDGWRVNLKRVLRVYRAEGLRVRKGRGRRKQVSAARVPRPVADGPNVQWTVDFIHDQFADGRRFRTLSVVDEYTRECLHLAPDRSWPSAQVAAALDGVAAGRRAPARIVLDNGPELEARALDAWVYGRGVELAFTRRGKPVDNCYVESFHDKFRDECLSTHWFLDLADARRLIAAWRDDYNAVRPHSALGNRTPAEFATLLHTDPERPSAHPTPSPT